MSTNLKPEIARELIAALRSGEYKKTTGTLRENGCFCVEGVLCDLLAKKGIGYWDRRYFVLYTPRNIRKVFGGIFPVDLHSEVTTDGLNPLVNYRPLAHWNDSEENLSFQEIADMIEKALKEK